MKQPIFLVGFMGSGKTTWGRKLASTLNLPFVDLDQRIVEKIGMPISEYFKHFGENSFREIERQVLLEQGGNQAIISTGGGTPCYFNNMEWIIKNGISLYLYHSPKSLWSRLSQSDINKRPALQGFSGDELLTFIEEKLKEREPYYDQASITIDQINTSIEDLVKIIHEYQNQA